MIFPRTLSRLLLSLLLASPVLADPTEQALTETIATMESDLQARIGIQILDTADGWTWGHRQDERFLMASTFKSVLCGAVLQAADQGHLSLTEPVAIRADQIHGHAPVTEAHVGGQLPVADLCLATLDLSDNGAANLLIDRLGGPSEVTAFLRGIGDPVTRLDRKEPDLNLFAPGDPRDTTSPAAMVATWQALLLGDALTPASRGLLNDWMSFGGVTGDFFRASAPAGWRIADKSGGGRDHTRAIVGLLTPPDRAPFVVAIYLSDTPANWSTRNKAVSDLSRAVVDLLKTR
jgi:beta-lactamase class A